MAKDKLTDYDATASNNTDIGGIDINQGTMIPSNVDNAIREIMSHLKDFAAGTEAVSSIAVSGDLTVDTNTLKVDSTNNNVGIGDNSPSAKLEIAGSSNSTYLIAGGDDSSNGRGLTFTSSASAAFNGAIHTINAPSSQGNIAFQITGSEKTRITTTGLTFNGDTAAANALDDYEQGTWTPVLTRDGTAFTTTPTYRTQLGEYTKIGKFVNATCRLRFANNFGGGSGAFIVSGLPYGSSGYLQGVSLALTTIFTGDKSHTQSMYITGTTVLFSSQHTLSSTPDDDYLVFTVNYMTT